MVREIQPSKIVLHETSKWSKKTASQVRKATGADVVINGTLFDYGTWKPNCDVKANGRVLNDDPYGYRGLGWMNGEGEFHIALSAEMNKWDNFISCVMLIYQGKDYPYIVDGAVGRSSGRTAILRRKNGAYVLWCVGEGLHNQTPSELRKSIYAKYPDIDWALMLDGGGSSQLSQEGNNYVYSSRKVQNYLCFWEADTFIDNEPEGGEVMTDVRAYSLKTDGNTKLTSNFLVKEFACKDGSDVVLIHPMLPLVLQCVRMRFNAAVTVNSGYRTVAYNQKVGGVAKSQHCLGTAADITVAGHTPAEVKTFLRQLMPDWGGVGVYAKQNFVHVDMRKTRTDWTG